MRRCMMCIGWPSGNCVECQLSDTQAERDRYKAALEAIGAKLERSHDGGCILPLRDMVNDALQKGAGYSNET